MWVAVVFAHEYVHCSNRIPYGDWSCFVNKDKDVAIEKALEAVRIWNTEDHRNSPYRILVGELGQEAKFPVNFKLQSLK